MVVYSQASEASTSPPGGWDGRTPSTSSATRSVGKSSPTTSPNPNPSTMSKPSTQLRFEDVYQSFRVASPASLFQQQESGPGHPTIDISGRRCLESFERLAPPMSWRRTFAASLVGMKGWFSTRCALTWKVKATKSSRSYFQLQASTRHTAETASGLLLTPTTREEQQMLPTPRAVEFVETPENFAKRNGDRTINSMPNLSSMAQHVPQMLPTPNTMDHIARDGMRPSRAATNRKTGYLSEMAQMLPTPNASDYKGGGTGSTPYAKKHSQDKLKYAATTGMLPTPMAQESDKITGKENQDSMTKRVRAATGKTSQLSPLFVEEMMGFPKGWTESPFQSGEGNQ